MAQGDTTITLVGNVVADPELRFTSSGVAVANFRVASTPRVFDSQSKQWTDGEPLFLTCHAWRDMANNVMDTLTKGMRVIVTGKLRQRSWETDAGEKRTFFEVDAEDVGPSLRFATAQVTRNPRGGGGGGRSNGGPWGGGPRSGPYAKNPDPAGGEQPPF